MECKFQLWCSDAPKVHENMTKEEQWTLMQYITSIATCKRPNKEQNPELADAVDRFQVLFLSF
jgi:hypothetical protein